MNKNHGFDAFYNDPIDLFLTFTIFNLMNEHSFVVEIFYL